MMTDSDYGLELDKVRGILRLASSMLPSERTQRNLVRFIRVLDQCVISGKVREFALYQLKFSLKINEVLQ